MSGCAASTSTMANLTHMARRRHHAARTLRVDTGCSAVTVPFLRVFPLIYP
jgi:hypothetical protein